ncbi:AT-rich interactive domain-containing protein 2 [Physocladia obscura]|uniref:AT-rich interactive domain-containing protein 2 n=1 Tax=Physocladia obscura TaxID=109957 RepID=A0AAD5T0A8_9FUNG|nr:AT-rich interactive domain-containing protein 2 [Physocladia obscura]
MRLRDTDEGIERTPQYYDFMMQLQQFHEECGTILQPEPILGGKKLDLYRIYLGVKMAGGFEKVTEDHGWQKICNPFEFPSTCTNSAYVVKKAYKQSIYNWVQVKELGVPISALKIDPSTKRGGDDEGNGPVKRVRAQQQHIPNAAAITTFVAPQRGNGAPIKVPEFAPDGILDVVLYSLPNLKMTLEKYLMGGSQNKLLLALQSGLSNEVDWAFNKLIRLSASFPPNFHVGSIAGLIDALIAHADPFFDILKLNTAVDNFETSPDHMRASELHKLPNFSEFSLFNSLEANQLMDRILQVMHILRNFSFTEMHIKFLIQQHHVLTIIAKSLALPNFSIYTALKHQSLDIFENMSTHIHLRGRHDFYLACLRKAIVDAPGDRALLLGSLRSLARLCGTDANHPHLCDIDQHVLERAWQLVCVRGDDELVYVALEFCYMFSCLGVEAVGRVVLAARPANIVGILVGFLKWNVEPPVVKGKKGVVAVPTQPQAQQLFTPMTTAPIISQQIVPQFQRDGAPSRPLQVLAPSGSVTPVRGNIVSRNASAIASPAPAKTSAEANSKLSVMSTAVSKKVATKEDEDVDIDGNDEEEEVLEEGKVEAKDTLLQSKQTANKQGPTPQTVSTPSFMDVFNSNSTQKKRGRPPKNKSEIDSYSAQLAQQMQQQQMMLLQQNPNMTPQEHQMMLSQLQQSHSAMLNTFIATRSSFAANGFTSTEKDEDGEDEEDAAIAAIEPSFECHWQTNGISCTSKFSNESDILKHMADDHFRIKTDSYSCNWQGCQAFHNTPGFRPIVFRHTRTHIGDSSKKAAAGPTKAFQQPLYKKPFKSGGIDGPDLIGTPLTALLILKNIARSQVNRDLFMPFEAEFALAMAERPKFSKIVAELMWELR